MGIRLLLDFLKSDSTALLPSPSMAESSPPHSCSSTSTLPGWWWWASRNSAQGASSSAGFQWCTAGPPMCSGGIEETVTKRTQRCPLGLSCYTPESGKNNRGWGMRTGSSVLPWGRTLRTYTLPCLHWPTSLHRWGELEEVQLWWGLAETGELRGVDHPATKFCQNKTLYPVKIKIADRVKKGKSVNLNMKKISWAQCLVPRGKSLHKGS